MNPGARQWLLRVAVTCVLCGLAVSGLLMLLVRMPPSPKSLSGAVLFAIGACQSLTAGSWDWAGWIAPLWAAGTSLSLASAVQLERRSQQAASPPCRTGLWLTLAWLGLCGPLAYTLAVALMTGPWGLVLLGWTHIAGVLLGIPVYGTWSAMLRAQLGSALVWKAFAATSAALFAAGAAVQIALPRASATDKVAQRGLEQQQGYEHSLQRGLLMSIRHVQLLVREGADIPRGFAPERLKALGLDFSLVTAAELLRTSPALYEKVMASLRDSQAARGGSPAETDDLQVWLWSAEDGHAWYVTDAHRVLAAGEDVRKH